MFDRLSPIPYDQKSYKSIYGSPKSSFSAASPTNILVMVVIVGLLLITFRGWLDMNNTIMLLLVVLVMIVIFYMYKKKF